MNAFAPALTHDAVQYVRDSLTLLFLGQPDRTRRFLVVYGAFWDESGTQTDDPWLTVAGFIATADKWVEFTADWKDALNHFGLTIFHANNFNARVGEYKGWSDKKRLDSSIWFTDVISRHVAGSVGISVPGPALRKQIPSSLKGKVGHPYAVASRLCMAKAAGLLRDSIAIEGGLTLNHMFAFGAVGHGQVEAIGQHESKRPNRVTVGSVTFGGQVDNPPLQAADFLAWELNRRTRQEREPEPPAMRTSLQRFSELPNFWRRLDEDHVGAQFLMALTVDGALSGATRRGRRSRDRSRHDR